MDETKVSLEKLQKQFSSLYWTVIVLGLANLVLLLAFSATVKRQFRLVLDAVETGASSKADPGVDHSETSHYEEEEAGMEEPAEKEKASDKKSAEAKTTRNEPVVRVVHKLSPTTAAEIASEMGRKEVKIQYGFDPEMGTPRKASLEDGRWSWNRKVDFKGAPLRVEVSFDQDGSNAEVRIANQKTGEIRTTEKTQIEVVRGDKTTKEEVPK